jgi:hypothetical protein
MAAVALLAGGLSKSCILQPAQPDPSLQISYGFGVQDVREQSAQIAKQLANLQLGQKIDPRPEVQQNGEHGRKAKVDEAMIIPAKIHSGDRDGC